VIFFVVAFVVVVIISIVFRQESSVQWMTDYKAGIAESTRLNKPALVCFYMTNGPFHAGMREGAWKNPKVIAFIKQTFVPILVSIDSAPELAKTYNASYDCATFIRMPDGTQSDQATHGNRPPDEYISKLQAKLAEMTSKKP
jgi:hypothetical protein